MGIKPKFRMSDIEREIDGKLEQKRLAAIRTLCYVGEEAVNTARSLPSPSAADFPDYPKIPPHQPNYIDWTANLKSSIGYVVVADGEIVQMSSFEAVQGEKGNGEEGSQKGRQFAEELASKYPTGYVLIVVAGMHYAAYVQSKGYDVLNSAAITAEQMLERLCEK